MIVNCVDCLAKWDSDDTATTAGLQNGTITEHDDTTGKRYFGICHGCQARHRRADKRSQRLSADSEMVQLRHLVAEFRQEHTLEVAVKMAVKILNDPWLEGDPGFRAYLLEHDAD